MFSKSKMFRLPTSLSGRLTLWYGASLASLLSVALFALYLAVATVLDISMDEDLEEDIGEFSVLYRQSGTDAVIREMQREVVGDEHEQVFLRLFRGSGKLLYTTDLRHWRALQDSPAPLNSNKEILLYSREFEGQEAPTRIVIGAIGDDLWLQIGESVEENQEILELLLWTSLAMLGLVLPLACAVGWAVSRQAVRGIVAVTRAATDIEQGQLDSRVSVRAYGDEVVQLVQTFNAMAERIRSLIAEMREMTDNIAHDLRSPLARIRAISEVALSCEVSAQQYQQAAADTLEECDRLLQLINTTLDVAEAEAGMGGTVREEVDISRLTEDACELFEPVAEEKGIRLSLELESGCRLRGNIHHLQRMLANLLDNALKYTPEAGSVAVKLARDTRGVNITVADTGIGIPEAEQSRVFDRFFRCDQSRSRKGCGLGLSYSRAVARAHGGDITLVSIPAKQSTFTVSLPV